MDRFPSDDCLDDADDVTRVHRVAPTVTDGGPVDAIAAARVLMQPAQWPAVEPGPLPGPARKYHRPSAYWADRWLTVRRP